MMCERTRHLGRVAAFTLIELLVVIAIISLLLSILLPSFARAKMLTRKTVCAVGLRGMHQAFVMYLTDSEYRYFPFREQTEAGTLWYWGLEDSSGTFAEGSRPIDTSRARLAPYFGHTGRAQICPEIRFGSDYLKPKFNLAGYGYAINHCMLSDMPATGSYSDIGMPHETITWADSMQINTWQAPGSPGNPLLEEWYYLDNRITATPKFHFRHAKNGNAAFADGGVRELTPYLLDPRCDGRVGRPEPPVPASQVSYLLRISK